MKTPNIHRPYIRWSRR